MKSTFIFSFLRISITVLFSFTILFSVIFIVISIFRLSSASTGKSKNNILYSYHHEVLAFGSSQKEPPFIYSQDSLIRYQGTKNRYTVQVKPDSGFGYYSLFVTSLFLGLGIAVLWNFRKIFREATLENPFRYPVIKRLKILSGLFIISDLIKISHYLVFNNLLHRSLESQEMQLLITIGDGIIIGLIIWIVAVIFERGIVLQEENALTV